LLGVFVIALHVRTATLQPPSPAVASPPAAGTAGRPTPAIKDRPSAQPEHIEDTLVWLPKQLDRTAIERLAMQEPRLVGLLIVLAGTFAAIMLIGLYLSLRDLKRRRLSELWRFTAPPLPAWSLGELGRIICLCVMVIALIPFVQLAVAAYQMAWKPDRNFWIAVSMLGLDGFIILTILAFANHKGRSAIETFGFVGDRPNRSIRTSVRGYVAAFPWLVLLLVAIVEVVRLTGWKPPEEPIAQLIFQEGRPLVLAMTMVLACVIGPIAEELLFRGVLYAAVRKRTSWVIAMLVSGALFALIHTNPLGFIPIMGLGCLLAYLYERTGSLAGPLLVHIVHNTLLMSLAMTVRQLMVQHSALAGQ
ncbi:MAG: hypothetical protein COV75_04235, partial [Candidatus Omnitrophica bacterium CG11_big_fil_rev_8_21_14_0_20_63_9]